MSDGQKRQAHQPVAPFWEGREGIARALGVVLVSFVIAPRKGVDDYDVRLQSLCVTKCRASKTHA